MRSAHAVDVYGVRSSEGVVTGKSERREVLHHKQMLTGESMSQPCRTHETSFLRPIRRGSGVWTPALGGVALSLKYYRQLLETTSLFPFNNTSISSTTTPKQPTLTDLGHVASHQLSVRSSIPPRWPRKRCAHDYYLMLLLTHFRAARQFIKFPPQPADSGTLKPHTNHLSQPNEQYLFVSSTTPAKCLSKLPPPNWQTPPSTSLPALPKAPASVLAATSPSTPLRMRPSSPVLLRAGDFTLETSLTRPPRES